MNYSNIDPPFLGFVKTTGDALLLFQAARTSVVPRVTRRLTDTERQSMIRSGSVFIWNEEECRIKRWTDSMTWSPSRIIGNFLVYRETTERGSGRSATARAARLAMRARDPNRSAGSARQRPPNLTPEELAQRSHERSIVGSLADDFGTFKPGGLVKKTMSLVIDGISHHLVSYYNPDDVMANKLPSPSSIPHISAVGIPPDLLDRRIGFSQPPRVELVNGVITYAGESADDTSLQRQDSFGTTTESGSPLQRTLSESSQNLSNHFESEIPFIDSYIGTTNSAHDTLTIPNLKLPQFDLSGDHSFFLEAPSKDRNASGRSLAPCRHEPYPTSSLSRRRCRLSISTEPSTACSSPCDLSYSPPNIPPYQSEILRASVENLQLATLSQPLHCGPYSAPASVPDYPNLVENPFPEYMLSFSPNPTTDIEPAPAELPSSQVAFYNQQYTHPHSPPPTPRIGYPSSLPNRPALTIETGFEDRFAYSCPQSTVPNYETLVTPPPTACTEPPIPSTLIWDTGPALDTVEPEPSLDQRELVRGCGELTMSGNASNFPQHTS